MFGVTPSPTHSLSLCPGSSSQNGSALRRELSGGSYGSKRQTMTSPSESSLSSGGGMDCGDAPLSQFDREVSKGVETEHTASCAVDSKHEKI